MAEKPNYEWIVEDVDGFGEIIDVNHSDKFPHMPFDNHVVALVYNAPDGIRSWAYIDENGNLPEYFEDAFQKKTRKVPESYKKEFDAAKAASKPSARYSDGNPTPTPWEYYPTGEKMHGYSQPLAIAQRGERNLIAGIFGDVRGGTDVAHANAKHIVKCVNEAEGQQKKIDALVEALYLDNLYSKALPSAAGEEREFVESECEKRGWKRDMPVGHFIAERKSAALKLAKGE